MPSRFAAASLLAILAVTLVACTPEAAPVPSAPSGDEAITDAPATAPSTGGGGFPGCDEVTASLGLLLEGLTFSEAVSAEQTAEEAYEQRVCVYLTADESAQLGVTLAAIPFLQSELDGYATLPNAVADDRLAERDAVMQVFAVDDAADGHLDSALYLFDTGVSITVQGFGKDGAETTTTLPQLSVDAAVDAAFAVRALVGAAPN